MIPNQHRDPPPLKPERNVVFLDIDGVLNSANYLRRCPGAFDGRTLTKMLDAYAVVYLNRIVLEGQADVVISSTWRILSNLSDIRSALNARGFQGKVIDKTPRYGTLTRGAEIRYWLDAQHFRDDFSVRSFVILDDDSDMDDLSERLVQTSWETGLRPEHADKAIALLRQRCAT